MSAPDEVTLSDVVAEAEALRTDVHAAEKARRILALVNLGLLALLIALGWQNYEVSRQVSETNKRVADCTTPGGHCYEDGRARTGAAIGDIVRAEVLVAECSRLYPDEAGPTFDAKLQACFDARLAAAAAKTPQPAPTPTPAPSPTRR